MGVPLLGVNLGHVGFLAELEREDLQEVVQAVVARDYRVEQRMTVDARILDNGVEVVHTWALNEVSIEKAPEDRMLDLMVEVDGRPLSRWLCDGVGVCDADGVHCVLLLRRGSDRLAGGGGPAAGAAQCPRAVRPAAGHRADDADRHRERRPGEAGGALGGWPQVVPAAAQRAHRGEPAPRARLVRPPARCPLHRPPGREVRAAHPGVARGPDGAAVIHELRITGLGVIAEATCRFAPGFTAVTGETGAGKTMVVSGLGLLAGGRADAGLVRVGESQAAVEGWFDAPGGGDRGDRHRRRRGSRR